MPRIPDLFRQPLAITEDKLDSIIAFYDTWRSKDRDLLASLRAPYAALTAEPPAEAPDSPYTVTDGVAVIAIEGTLFSRANLVTAFSGGTTPAGIRASLRAALDDPAVTAIVLAVSSPGGEVTGIEETADLIYALRAEKPVIAYADGLMASAAYWIGSAAEEVIVEPSAAVGSIGVVTLHTDLSRADEKAGIKRTYLTAGAYKALGNDAEPLTEAARADIQGRLTYIYSRFVDTVARNRGVTAEEILPSAEGRIYLGTEAITAGLADAVGTLEDAIDRARTMAQTRLHHPTVRPAPRAKERTMPNPTITTLEQLAAAYPDLVAQARDDAHNEGAASVNLAETVAAATASATGAERDRIIGLASVLLDESSALALASLCAAPDLITQHKIIKEHEAAKVKAAPPDAEAAVKAAILAGIQASGAPNPGRDAGSIPDDQLPAEERAKKKWNSDPDIRAQFSGCSDPYAAFIEAEKAFSSGQARVIAMKDRTHKGGN